MTTPAAIQKWASRRETEQSVNLQRVRKNESSYEAAGLAHWLLARLRGARKAEPRLALVERISLAPRQTLALVEAEGRRFLIASSGDGAPAFYPLEGGRAKKAHGGRARASW
jgi:hypothetical protein